MKREFLGDSDDAVKRMWQQILANSAPLYAEPRFIPNEMQASFTLLTGIPMLSTPPSTPFSILNDPDTGVRLPGELIQTESQKHISIPTILGQLQHQSLRCIVTFDQSEYPHRNLKLNEQRVIKMRSIFDGGAFAFYYVSHAPFLFVFPTGEALEEIKALLFGAGIPEDRIELLSCPLQKRRIAVFDHDYPSGQIQ